VLEKGAADVRFGSKSRHRIAARPCPLYPQKRTLAKRGGMSAKCQTGGGVKHTWVLAVATRLCAPVVRNLKMVTLRRYIAFVTLLSLNPRKPGLLIDD
jgi:hypothetical protein